MTDNFFVALAAILLIPVIPAYILYKFLPSSESDVSGPYQGLSVKLKGAFAGYFLLVLAGIAMHYVFSTSKDKKTLETLMARQAEKDSLISQLRKQVSGAVTDWYIKGLLLPAGKEGTRFFYDDGTTTSNPDGSFQLIKRSLGKEGLGKPPAWMCIYNPSTGFRVISLNREVSHPDISTFNVVFDDVNHVINIKRPIEINSIAADSIVAVAGYIDRNGKLRSEVEKSDPGLLLKAGEITRQRQENLAKLSAFKKRQAAQKPK